MKKVNESTEHHGVPSSESKATSELSAASSTKEIVGAVVDCLMTDMNTTSERLRQLAEQVGYDNGYEDGFRAGAKAAQRRVSNAIFDVQIAAGLGREHERA